MVLPGQHILQYTLCSVVHRWAIGCAAVAARSTAVYWDLRNLFDILRIFMDNCTNMYTAYESHYCTVLRVTTHCALLCYISIKQQCNMILRYRTEAGGSSGVRPATDSNYTGRCTHWPALEACVDRTSKRGHN